MDDLIKFQMNNINQITLEQLEHQFVLKKIEIYCDKQVSNETIEKEIQKSENSKDQEINLLENQINHFINKNFKLNLLNQQFQQTSQNRDQIQNEQAQIVQNLTNVESELKEQLKSCQQELQKLHLEKKIINLQKLNHKLNSITFKKQILKEIQIQTDVTIQDFEKVELLNKEIQLELKQNQEKMPQYLDQINVLKTEINSLKQKHLFTLFSKSYQPQFNASYKLAAYHVANSKLIQSPQGGFGIAIMQPSLPKNQLTIFAFKINKYDCWLGVGITHLQTAQSFNYDMNANYTQQNHNTYLACAGGYRISSHQGYNGQTKFIYQQGSIIICCYDPLTFKLSLLHLNDGKTYELELANNINLEMSPCVMLYGNSEVEVL